MSDLQTLELPQETNSMPTSTGRSIIQIHDNILWVCIAVLQTLIHVFFPDRQVRI